MLYTHNPAQHTFNWYCNIIDAKNNNSSRSMIAAKGLKNSVRKTREGYQSPFGITFPYDQESFQNVYLVAYFPYYIEPLYHVLKAANLPEELFSSDSFRASFFGGGPCPEALGLAAYLREKAPNLQSVDISIFDRENSWNTIQQGLLAEMLLDYAASDTKFSVKGRQCNVTKCVGNKCSSGNTVSGSDLVIAQNFLAEVQTSREATIETFEGIVSRSNCRYLVFIENNYGKNKEILNLINHRLHIKDLSAGLAKIGYNEIRPNFPTPNILSRYLYENADGLRARKTVKYHYMIIEIKRP